MYHSSTYLSIPFVSHLSKLMKIAFDNVNSLQEM